MAGRKDNAASRLEKITDAALFQPDSFLTQFLDNDAIVWRSQSSIRICDRYSCFPVVVGVAAIQNLDITTNNFEAEFGRAVGTVVNVTLKSGTNEIHGSVFQSMENNGVNARNYFATGPNGRLVYNFTGEPISQKQTLSRR
jgi:sporulation protein YlmC with PRC-barrel domain